MTRRHHITRFTPEQLEKLAANPFTREVTGYRISFTAEFKEQFLSQYETGRRVRDIFKDLGYDPAILGDSRIYSFSTSLLHKIETGSPTAQPQTTAPAHNGQKKPAVSAAADNADHLDSSDNADDTGGANHTDRSGGADSADSVGSIRQTLDAIQKELVRLCRQVEILTLSVAAANPPLRPLSPAECAARPENSGIPLSPAEEDIAPA